MGMFKKEANRSGLFLLIKLSAGVLLSSALVACGGGSSSGGGNNGGGGSDPFAHFTCQTLNNNEHDGICVTVDGNEHSAFYRNIFVDYRPGENKGNAQYHVAQKTGNYSGSFAVEFPLDQGASLNCDDLGVQITAALKVGSTTRNFTANPTEGSCHLQYSQQGRVITGQYGGELEDGNGNTRTLTEGYFRISLEGASDHISGETDRELTKVDIDYYQPGGTIRFSAFPATGNSDEQWTIWIADLSQPSPASCDGSYTKNMVTYYDTNGNEEDDYHSCEISYSVNNGVLSGTFSGDHEGSFSVSLPDGPLVDNLP